MLRSLLDLFLFLLLLAVIAVLFVVVTSPFNWRRIDVSNHPALIHAVDGKRVDVHFEHIPFALQKTTQSGFMQLLVELDHHLRRVGCKYWAVKSTLLAAIRHGQPIPWVDEMSIAIMYDDLRKLVGCREAMEHSGKVVLKHGKHAYYFCANNTSCYPCIEINIMQTRNHEISVCTPTDELGQCSFQDSYLRRKEIFSVDAVFPLRFETFDNFVMPVPQKAEECLSICYGSDWKSISLWHPLNLVKNQYAMSWLRKIISI